MPSFSDTPSNIRANTLHLSRIQLSPPTSVSSPSSFSLISPLTSPPPPPGSIHIDPAPPTPRGTGPSALSKLIAESRAGSREPSRSPERDGSPKRAQVQERDPIPTPTPSPTVHRHTSTPIPPPASVPLLIPQPSTPPLSETTPLLPTPAWYPRPASKRFAGLLSRIPSPPTPSEVLHALPAVIAGLLLNILDGVSYGMIIFPAVGVFEGFGGTGVSMFFVTTIISQLVYSLGGSGFAGANGSMMIEVVPFFHILANTIASEIGEHDPRAIIATTIASFALSSILTGLAFFTLGFLNLGVLIEFFPRHILVGCIGGVGIFLVETGFEVSATLSSSTLTYSFSTLFLLFKPHNLIRWAPALGLALGLKSVMMKWKGQLVFVGYFLSIPVLFYAVALTLGLDVGTLRREGWLFDMGEEGGVVWYHFYGYFDLSKTRWEVIWMTVPTQLALLFFNVLHPPLNVPALAVSLDQDVDTNKELVAHGYSNLLAGITGSVPNYLVYVNTLLFYRVGGGTRIAGFMLAVFTAGLLVVGTAPIGYIPIMVVGALIFVLGMDLIKEALWDTRHRASRSEYITIVSIMVCMTLWDFVIGVLFGIVVSCIFFVVQNSQARSIRALYTGDAAISTVRRPSAHRAYLREVAKQTVVMRLQGHLFFGTITQVEARIRHLLDASSWRHNPLRFIVVDLALVAGVDLSSAEAFVRVQRLLAGRRVILVLCGFEMEGEVGRALEGVGLVGDGDGGGGLEGVEVFSYLNEALEWTENVYLKAWLASQKNEIGTREHVIAFPGRQQKLPIQLAESIENSPRRAQLRDAGGRIFSSPSGTGSDPELYRTLLGEPYETLLKVFSSHGPLDPLFYRPLLPYFTRVTVSQGEIIWKQGEPPDALYLIQSGILRASYRFAAASGTVEESMVAGTVAGELSALSGTTRNATVVVERDAVLWRLGTDDLQRLEGEQPDLARTFMKLVLKSAKIDYDMLIAALAAGQ